MRMYNASKRSMVTGILSACCISCGKRWCGRRSFRMLPALLRALHLALAAHSWQSAGENRNMRQAHIGPPTLMQLRMRERLWHQAGKRCHWCGSETLLCLEPVSNQATVDHIVPRCRGGSSKVENCVNSCFTCNAKRNREDQTKAGHPSNKPSEKQRLRRARDEAVLQLQNQIEINGALSNKVAEYQTMSLWAFLRLKFVKRADTKQAERWLQRSKSR